MLAAGIHTLKEINAGGILTVPLLLLLGVGFTFLLGDELINHLLVGSLLRCRNLSVLLDLAGLDTLLGTCSSLLFFMRLLNSELLVQQLQVTLLLSEVSLLLKGALLLVMGNKLPVALTV